MNQFDKNYWTKRYQKNETGWDAGQITTPLKEYIDQLEDKSIQILIPGAGNAYEAQYLLKQGFRNVTVLDISPEPLANIKKRLPDFPSDNLIQQDFFEHQAQYDLILEQTFFCALDPSMRNQYSEQMFKLLKAKGKLVGVLFTQPLNAIKPPFGATIDEYIKYFKSHFDIKTMDTCYNSIKPRVGSELFIVLQKK
jgi:SAM-dependent methyltransferase